MAATPHDNDAPAGRAGTLALADILASACCLGRLQRAIRDAGYPATIVRRGG